MVLRTFLLFGAALLGFAASAPASNDISPWQNAIQHNNTAKLRELLAEITSVDQATHKGKTALMAAALNGDAKLVQDLLQAGADPNATNQTGGTALMYGMVGGSLEVLEHLLAAKAAVNHSSSNGWTPLMMAVAKRKPELVARLCQAGAGVNAADVYGWTPLMRAAYEGYATEAKILLAQPGLDLERINDHGQTALHLAVIGQHSELVALLLAHGAAERSDFAQRTPLTIATELHNQAIIDLLNQH